MIARELRNIPDSMAALPLDGRGLPVPHFVPWFDGEPDFSRVKPGALEFSHQNNLCWLCNEFLGVSKWFILDDITRCINRTASHLPSHRACAEFAAKNYPCMTQAQHGCSCLWETNAYRVFTDLEGRITIDIGEASGATFWCDGRKASQEQVLESVRNSIGKLQAEAIGNGPMAMVELVRKVEDFRRWLDRVLPAVVPQH